MQLKGFHIEKRKVQIEASAIDDGIHLFRAAILEINRITVNPVYFWFDHQPAITNAVKEVLA